MRTVFLLFDSLNRRSLGCYGGREVPTPNFDRLAARGVTFDNHWVGSLPCIPARRDLHTGRLNLFHRSWGPLEPFDDSFASILTEAGNYTHLATDHYHYFEEGGCGYHNQYSSFDFRRGQEKDKWKGVVDLPVERWRHQVPAYRMADKRDAELSVVALMNRDELKDEADWPLVQTFEDGLEFLARNHGADDWLLNIECFDPHEPFTAPRRFKEQCGTAHNGIVRDWPLYGQVTENAEEVAEIRGNYNALLAACDAYLGQLLDFFDEHDLWKDTAVVLTTDHGIMLGEHDWWGKMRMPFFNEVSHIPLIICHPEFAAEAGTRRQSLTQTIDVMPTLLDLHGVDIPEAVRGFSLIPVLQNDTPVRETAVFGMFGGSANITDGRYTYFLYPQDMNRQELSEHTLMPTHMRSYFAPEELEDIELVGPFDFTKGLKVLRARARMNSPRSPLKGATIEDTGSVLYDLDTDPGQTRPIEDAEVEARLKASLFQTLQSHDAPGEAFRRFGFTPPAGLSVP